MKILLLLLIPAVLAGCSPRPNDLANPLDELADSESTGDTDNDYTGDSGDRFDDDDTGDGGGDPATPDSSGNSDDSDSAGISTGVDVSDLLDDTESAANDELLRQLQGEWASICTLMMQGSAIMKISFADSLMTITETDYDDDYCLGDSTGWQQAGNLVFTGSYTTDSGIPATKFDVELEEGKLLGLLYYDTSNGVLYFDFVHSASGTARPTDVLYGLPLFRET